LRVAGLITSGMVVAMLAAGKPAANG